MTAFSDLAEYILAPLAGLPPSAWEAGPAGKWTPGQVVAHLAIAMTTSADGIEAREGSAPMRRRPRTVEHVVAQLCVLTVRWFPPGRQAPDTARPPAHPDRDATEQQLRTAVERWVAIAQRLLPARGSDLFLKHAVLGDLTIAEWMRFHLVHAAHHRKQIAARVRSPA